MVKHKAEVFVLLCLLFILAACQTPPEVDEHISDFSPDATSQPSPSVLEQLLLDVFDPLPGEKVLFLVDLPNEKISDNPAWAARRAMADEWQDAFRHLSGDMGFTVANMVTYPATGGHNSPLPEIGTQGGESVNLEQLISQVNIVVAMTEFSATSPLTYLTERYPKLRVASMPTVSPSMMDSALSADYRQLAVKCQQLASRLDQAESANLIFSTGHQLTIDLRFRQAELDAGYVHADEPGPRIINLPSGEAFIAPYEGERPGFPSRTEGQIPLPTSQGSYVTLTVKENRISDVDGEAAEVLDITSFFEVDEARRNLAELGLGCNDQAVISGNVLEDEKVLGVHLASGLSEHIGGVTGVDDFLDPASAVHQDRVYPSGDAIEVTNLVLVYKDGSTESIIQDGRFSLPPID